MEEERAQTVILNFSEFLIGDPEVDQQLKELVVEGSVLE